MFVILGFWCKECESAQKTKIVLLCDVYRDKTTSAVAQ